MGVSSISSSQPALPENETDPTLGTELNTASDGIALTEPHSEPTNSSRRLHIYSAVLLLVPFVYMAVCFVLMRSDYILRHTQNAYIANMGYGLKLNNANCEILVYGDSTALVGVDPGVLRRATGLSACNIADYAGMLRLNGTMVLDRYLAHNARPKYLVMVLAPDDLAPTWRHDGNYEAVLMRVREKPDASFLYTLLRHGEDILSAIGVTGRFAVTDMLHRSLAKSVYRERDDTGGRFPDPLPRSVACPPDLYPSPPDREWVNGLRTRYGVDGTRVIVDVVPVPPCEPNLAIYQREFPPGNGVVDNELHIYPLNWYTQSGQWHLGAPEGWQHLSTEIADQIRSSQLPGSVR